MVETVLILEQGLEQIISDTLQCEDTMARLQMMCDLIPARAYGNWTKPMLADGVS